MKRYSVAFAALLTGVAIWLAPNVQATENDYFDALAYNGVVVWDYPLLSAQGRVICQLLYEDINPYPWLTLWVGYDSLTASSIIVSARQGLCPGNAVTA